ncbi:PIG-L family deacetylase [Leeuwenhoekiella sp. A2]|uniref:PIG-L family deacetylase n=1 Tax=Leeuwenhoekiella sp. A2 TaxID=3141460 RepID=UPI003A80A1EE
MQKLSYLLLFLILFSLNAKAQKPEKPTSAEIFEDIQKLNFLGTALYIGAHPDDENTALISYLANQVKARTGYLSLTRGDGGQNLVGPEIRELLGVIRTQELLSARRIDGGEQRFTRANDFGYSKNPEETLEFWEKDKVLSDVVWAIRNFKPDIIINRFDHRSPGTTHGHHTTSAMLSVQAFDLVNDPSKFPEQLKYTTTWQPKREFFNTSWWFYGSQEKFDKADKSNLVALDDGVYYPAFGLSNTEISALSRSQHKSQGFGNTGSRGSQTEYLELLRGDYPANGNLFAGVDTSWNRVKGGRAIGEILSQVENSYDFTDPAASLPALVTAYNLIDQLKDEHWRELKLKEITGIIKACAGLYLEATTSQELATANENIDISIEAINRSNTAMQLKNVVILPLEKSVEMGQNLLNNTDFRQKISINTGNAALTTPYWLNKPGSVGMYNVEDQKLIGLPETPHEFKAIFNIDINGVTIPFKSDLVYKYNDQVKGEVFEPFDIVPPVSAAIDEPVIIFSDSESKKIGVRVTAYKSDLKASVTLKHDDNWQVSPSEQNVSITSKGESTMVYFDVTPPAHQDSNTLIPEVNLDGNVYSKKVIQIDYGYIPLQTLTLPSQSQIVKLNIKKAGDFIGYIAGAGDVIPESLQQIGYQVAVIDPEKITPEYLDQFDAVVMGIRAYNTVDILKYKQQALFDYVQNGGTMVVQYNTARGFNFPNVGPYPLTLSSDRVTDENAQVRILDPSNEILNYPNKITDEDFKGWVQERGLYFPTVWNDAYKPVISINDKGENALDGSLLMAQYGKGHYIYTGLSFFRELPAGVPGAYRLFANLLSVGKSNEKIKG